MNDAFPRWSAPLLGAVAGAFLGYRADPGIASPAYVGGGALIGILGGCLVFLLDSKPQSASQHEEALREANPNYVNDQVEHFTDPGLVGRFLALIAIVLCIVPIAGLVMGLIAVAVNWKARGWSRMASRIGAGIGLVVTTLVVLTMVIES
ncbi:MAG: hypothetical protein AAF456_10330 [Planctomycetota bacterium]